VGNSNSGILGTLFSLLFKRNRNNSVGALTDQPEPPREHHALGGLGGLGFATMLMGGKFDDAFVDRIEMVIERSGSHLNPEMVQQLLGSEQFRERLDEASQQRIRAALAKVTGGASTDAKPAELAQEPAAGPAPTAPSAPSAPSAWKPDARTTGDANWQSGGVIKGDDPWNPGGKKEDPWHPDGGAKKNDPWHPGD
jgi:hypothetical protein